MSGGAPGKSDCVGDATESARNIVRRKSSAIWQELPKTPAWAVLLCAIASAGLGYELQLQKELTCAPLIFFQEDTENELIYAIYKQLTRHNDAILSQPVQPSLLVGTRSLLSTFLSLIHI